MAVIRDFLIKECTRAIRGMPEYEVRLAETYVYIGYRRRPTHRRRVIQLVLLIEVRELTLRAHFVHPMLDGLSIPSNQSAPTEHVFTLEDPTSLGSLHTLIKAVGNRIRCWRAVAANQMPNCDI